MAVPSWAVLRSIHDGRESGGAGWLLVALATFLPLTFAHLPELLQKNMLGLLLLALLMAASRAALRAPAWGLVVLLCFVLIALAHLGTLAVALLWTLALGAMLRSRTGTCSLSELGGLWGAVPCLSACFLLFALGSLGLPGLANFVGEILVLLGTFRAAPLWALLALPGLLLAAAYLLRLIQGTLWGPAPAARAALADLSAREWLILAPLALLTIFIGVHPAPLLEPLNGAIQAILGGVP